LGYGIAGDQVNQQENDADYQPDDWEGVEDALEERFQFSVPGLVTRFTLKDQE
jgi:hypothetical protein